MARPTAAKGRVSRTFVTQGAVTLGDARSRLAWGEEPCNRVDPRASSPVSASDAASGLENRKRGAASSRPSLMREAGETKSLLTSARKPRPNSVKPERLAADTAYGSAANLNWLVNDKKIAPHITVIDKSKREDGSLSRDDFTFDRERNVYVCPEGKVLTTTGAVGNDHTLRYFALKRDCDACSLKPRCCPKTPSRKITRDVHEDACDVARALAKTEAFEQSRRDRKRVEMLFAHLTHILRLGHLRLRGPRDFCNKIVTELPTSALQRFRPESEGQLTFGGRDHEDRS
jgi:hypothetical protein